MTDPSPKTIAGPPLSEAPRYASGEEPKRGDLICHETRTQIRVLPLSLEEQQIWIVTSIVGDMVWCKCQDAERWRQAHYVNQMCLVKRHNVKLTDAGGLERPN